MLESVNLTKYYPPPIKGIFDLKSIRDFFGRSRESIPALVDLTFKVKDGEIFGILGPNGAGKTTFCKIANALIFPTRGGLYIDGHDIITEHDKIKGSVLTIFGGDIDLFGLFQWRLSVEKNLLFVSKLWGIPKNEAVGRINYALGLLDLKEKKNEWYQKLSAGMRRKVYLALPFIIQPQILILDEPTVYLDVFTRNEILDAIRRLSRELGTTIILTTHNLNEAEMICDRVMILNKRKIVEGRPKDLIREFQSLQVERKISAWISGQVDINKFGEIVKDISMHVEGGSTYLEFYVGREHFQDALKVLSEHPVVDIQISALTFEEVFQKLLIEKRNVKKEDGGRDLGL